MKKDVLVIIPARYASSRFPGKPLARIGGVEMIVRVCRRVSEGGWPLIVATDDTRIADCVERAGFRAIMTDAAHPNGTHRVEEALRLSGLTPEIVINVQGDEPFIATEQLYALAGCFDNPGVDIATLVRKFPADAPYSRLEDPGLVKVVTAEDGRALYFSRSVIPYLRGVEREEWPSRGEYLTHVGVYAYRREVLGLLVTMPQGRLEKAESLEQLCWLEGGLTIATALTDAPTIGIDTPEDLAEAEKWLAK
ncbi:MAG: 3-deoxy-manno-octulosonate cytidylyltransferase [Muribaculaceae bacterium]|nr:3-deoxy-manno-octulosonate cytidylyltransferase [Muribaculaceae bacterium]